MSNPSEPTPPSEEPTPSGEREAAELADATPPAVQTQTPEIAAKTPPGATPPPEEEPYPPIGYAWYVVAVLMVIYVLSFVDRQILSLLVAPIRRDLEISDTQMSLLMGFAFAVFYTFFGIPLGRVADTKSRRGLIAAGLAVWSLMTAGCGLATRFWQFLLLRMGVGVGEAALSPSAYSLITDYFPRDKLATAISVYSMGIYIGSGMAYLLGGVVVQFASGAEDWVLPVAGEVRPWQVVFFVVGLPGVLLTALLLTVKEPARRGVKKVGGKIQGVPFKQVLSYMRQNTRTILCHNLGFAFLAFSAYGTAAWVPEFMRRTHDWTPQAVGYTYGTMVIIFGTLGIVFGGWLSDRLAQRGVRSSKLWTGVIAATAWAPTGILYPIVPEGWMAAVLLAPTVFFASMPFGAAPAAVQEMMPPTMRAQASAIYLFIVNLIGLGIGPTAVALVNDYIFQDESMLRYSLLIVPIIAHIASALLLWAGTKPYARSLDRLEEYHAAQS